MLLTDEEEAQLAQQLDRLTPPQLVAFLYNEPKIGPDRLRQMLAEHMKLFPRECAEEIAGQLKELGLIKAADLVEDFARTQPHLDDLALCDDPPGSIGEKVWLSSRRRDREEHERKRQARKTALKQKIKRG